MNLGFEIYTTKVLECKEFYTQYFGFSVKVEMEGFVVLQHSKYQYYKLLFCIPNSPFVHPIFHPEFTGKGALLQMEVDNVESEYERIKAKDIQIAVSLVNEPVNGFHFSIQDPSGLLIDIVQID